MKALAILVLLASTAHADAPSSGSSIDMRVRARVATELPANLGVAKVHVPAQLEKLDLAGAVIAIELPRELRAGRASVKVIIPGRAPVWIPISITALSDVAVAQRSITAGQAIGPDDIAIERRAIDGNAAPSANVVGGIATRKLDPGEPIAARDVTLPQPLARGTQVAIEIRRGTLKIRGTAILETAARPGNPATARLGQTHTIVKGTLVAPATLVVAPL